MIQALQLQIYMKERMERDVDGISNSISNLMVVLKLVNFSKAEVDVIGMSNSISSIFVD